MDNLEGNGDNVLSLLGDVDNLSTSNVDIWRRLSTDVIFVEKLSTTIVDKWRGVFCDVDSVEKLSTPIVDISPCYPLR